MAVKIALTLKFLLVWSYSYALSPVASAVNQTYDKPSEAVFYIFVGMIFLPEGVLILSKGFRDWIKEGIENADGKLNHQDVKDLVVHYASLNALRIFVLESLLMMFYDIHVEFHYYVLPFLGSIGLSGFTIFKNLYGGRMTQ